MSSQMVLKQVSINYQIDGSFRSMSSQMVLKLNSIISYRQPRFRSMSSQMVLKPIARTLLYTTVLDLCHLKWY